MSFGQFLNWGLLKKLWIPNNYTTVKWSDFG